MDSSELELLHKDVLIALQESKNKVGTAWHVESCILDLLKDFENKKCFQPEEEMKKAKLHLENFVKTLKDDLSSFGCQEIIYTGSSYEGLKINLDGLEFDIMFVLNGEDLKTESIEGHEGYSHLVLKEDSPNWTLGKHSIGNDVVKSKKIHSEIFSVVQNIAEHYDRREFKAISHFPAIQINAYKNEKLWYSVDLVPCYKLKDDEGNIMHYVPKPLDKTLKDPVLSISWRRSFSKEEKQIIKNIDDDGGCRRRVLRILKGIFKSDPNLQGISSYYLKTVMMHVNKRSDLSWKQSDLHERLFDMIAIITEYCKKKYIPHYFVPETNLLKDVCGKKIENIANRLSGLRTKRIKLQKHLKNVLQG